MNFHGTMNNNIVNCFWCNFEQNIFLYMNIAPFNSNPP